MVYYVHIQEPSFNIKKKKKKKGIHKRSQDCGPNLETKWRKKILKCSFAVLKVFKLE